MPTTGQPLATAGSRRHDETYSLVGGAADGCQEEQKGSRKRGTAQEVLWRNRLADYQCPRLPPQFTLIALPLVVSQSKRHIVADLHDVSANITTSFWADLPSLSGSGVLRRRSTDARPPCPTSNRAAPGSCSQSPTSATCDAVRSMLLSAATASPTARAPATTIPATAPGSAPPSRVRARRSSRRSPILPESARPNATWPSSAASSTSMPNSSKSLSSSVCGDRPELRISSHPPQCRRRSLRAIQDAVQDVVASLPQPHRRPGRDETTRTLTSTLLRGLLSKGTEFASGRIACLGL